MLQNILITAVLRRQSTGAADISLNRIQMVVLNLDHGDSLVELSSCATQETILE